MKYLNGVENFILVISLVILGYLIIVISLRELFNIYI